MVGAGERAEVRDEGDEHGDLGPQGEGPEHERGTCTAAVLRIHPPTHFPGS